MVDFPDHSAQEEIVRTSGNVELLLKRGEKILRVNKGWWGTEESRWKYEMLHAYFSGRVLHVGLGMGISCEEILKQGGVTEVICQDCCSDIVAIYEAEHDPDARLTCSCCDSHTSKPSGTFGCVLVELPWDNQTEYEKCKSYLSWAFGQLNTGGYLICPHDRFSVALMAELTEMSPVVLSAQDRAPNVKLSLAPQPVWFVVQK